MAQNAEFKESVDNAKDLQKQVNKLLNRGPEPDFNTSSSWVGAEPAEQSDQEKRRFAEIDTLGMAGELQAFKEEVCNKLKQVNMKLGGLTVTPAKCEEI